MKHARGEKVARSTVIYDEADSVIETHAREGNFKEAKFNGKNQRLLWQRNSDNKLRGREPGFTGLGDHSESVADTATLPS
jgi:hypothetical protein